MLKATQRLQPTHCALSLLISAQPAGMLKPLIALLISWMPNASKSIVNLDCVLQSNGWHRIHEYSALFGTQHATLVPRGEPPGSFLQLRNIQRAQRISVHNCGVRAKLVRIGKAHVALAGLVFLLLPLVHSSAQQIAKRLILKDGSYQSATKWEVHGDRVRYYSAERDGWEEVPNSMVDWPATEKYEKEREAGAASPEAIALNKELEADRAARDANAPQVAPGLRLEDSNAGYLLDTFQGQQQLVQLKQDSGTVEHNIRKTIFHGDVARGPSDILLAGAHAGVQAHVPLPSLYVNAGVTPGTGQSSSGAQPPTLPWDRFRIVSLDLRPDKRLVPAIKNPSDGDVIEQQGVVKTTDEQLTGGWVKITPLAPLSQGEYALVELLGDEGINLYVWDFAINADAPANQNAEQASQPGAPGSAEPPKLKGR
jgi:hypothetical protein